MKILTAIAIFALAGCASLGGGTTPAQPVNTIMTVLATAASFAANGCIPQISVDPATACAPVNSVDPIVIQTAFNNCLTATTVQLALANVKVPRCQTIPASVVVTPPPPVVVTPVPVVVPGPTPKP